MSVAATPRRPRAPPFVDPPGYARHRPESTLLYQLVEQHYPTFRELREEAGRSLPHFVQQKFDAYLKCGRMEEGFLRVRCEQCHAEKLVAFSCKKRGFCPSCGARLRAAITPANRGTGASKRTALAAVSGKPPTPRHVAMSWAQRLKRVFGIEIDSGARCGGKLEVIASIEEPEVIAKILAHLERVAPEQCSAEWPLGARAPPRSPAGRGSDGERRLGGPMTRPGRGGACRHCSRRQARVVGLTASRDEPGIQGPAQRQPGAQAAAVAGFSLAAATAALTSGPLCEPNRAGEAL